jgi:threonylcarbamoyladenosine tRNA methylthiotransferase MtaB
MNKKIKIAVTTLGCKVNQFESASFITVFKEADCEIVPFAKPADIYIINTCAVTGRAAQQSRQLFRRAMRNNPNARIMVTGCYAQIAAEQLSLIGQDNNQGNNKIRIIGNGNKHLLVKTALRHDLPDMVMLTGEIREKKEICPLPVRRFSGRTRAFLRVQDGCNNFCSYCIIPYCRGQSRSSSLSSLTGQMDIFVEEGYREVIVTGINIGKYGLDLNEGEDIYSLLDKLCGKYPQTRIRLSSIEPTEINDRLLELMVYHSNFMPHLHIPLQSGDDRILALMNRKYTVELFSEKIKKITSALPHAAIGCDVLVGFPGEDTGAAENTRRLLSDLPVSYLHIFPYSSRPGTPATSFGEQVSSADKRERVKLLGKVDQEKRISFYLANRKKSHRVLIENLNGKNGLLNGFSENYIPLQFTGSEKLIGKVIPVKYEKLKGEKPLARIKIDDEQLELPCQTL